MAAGTHETTGGYMRRAQLLAVAVVAVTALAGCPSKPRTGECRTSEDCLSQEGYGKVCVEGRCQECAEDRDCKEGFVCRDNRCTPRPQCTSDADCGPGERCENERCVAARDEDADAEARRRGAVPQACADPEAFTVRFGFNQATLGAEGQGALQRLVDCLKQAPARRVVVAGHADERGTTQYNIALSARRAEAARRYLSDLGAGGKLETVSFGEEQPLCNEATEECWARNRRVEFQVER
jgi:peptidoglycan-associated lipoprotein